jgi:hypothetical protein
MNLWVRMLDGWYGYAIDELERLLRECPDDLWEQNVWEVKPEDRVATLNAPDERPISGAMLESVQVFGSFWFVAFHTLSALDAYLSPQVPWQAPAGFEASYELPVRMYSSEELLEYLAYCRVKAHETFASLTDDRAAQTRTDEPFASALVRGLMHLREHTGQLGLFLGWKRKRFGPSSSRETH